LNFFVFFFLKKSKKFLTKRCSCSWERTNSCSECWVCTKRSQSKD